MTKYKAKIYRTYVFFVKLFYMIVTKIRYMHQNNNEISIFIVSKMDLNKILY